MVWLVTQKLHVFSLVLCYVFSILVWSFDLTWIFCSTTPVCFKETLHDNSTDVVKSSHTWNVWLPFIKSFLLKFNLNMPFWCEFQRWDFKFHFLKRVHICEFNLFATSVCYMYRLLVRNAPIFHFTFYIQLKKCIS